VEPVVEGGRGGTSANLTAVQVVVGAVKAVGGGVVVVEAGGVGAGVPAVEADVNTTTATVAAPAAAGGGGRENKEEEVILSPKPMGGGEREGGRLGGGRGGRGKPMKAYARGLEAEASGMGACFKRDICGCRCGCGCIKILSRVEVSFRIYEVCFHLFRGPFL